MGLPKSRNMTEAALHTCTRCLVVLDSPLMGGPADPTSLRPSLLPMWENAALGKPMGTAGWKPCSAGGLCFG